MSFFSDLFGGVVQHGKDVFGGFKDNPFRALIGSADPFSTDVWNMVLGRDDKPLVSQYGGTTEEQFARMDAEGKNTGPKRQVDGIADMIASFFGMQGLGGAAGNMGGGGGGTNFMNQVQTGGGTGAPVQGGFMGQVNTGGPQGFMSQVPTGGAQSGSNPLMELMGNLPGAQQGQAQQQGSMIPLPGAAPGPASASQGPAMLQQAMRQREEDERQREFLAMMQELLRGMA